MRDLFVSEKRCIENLTELKWGRRCGIVPTVLAESTATPTKTTRPWFNCDFGLELADRTVPREHVATMTPVLPNTLGAELFLVVESGSLTPLWLELIGEEAFPITHYAKLIEHVEAAAMTAAESAGLPAGAALFEHAAWARVLMVGNDVTFLYFATNPAQGIAGPRRSLVHGHDRQIDCYFDKNGIVGFDGWVRAHVEHRPNVLVATKE